MSLRNIRLCSCQRLQSIIRRENFINSRQNSIYARSLINHSSRPSTSILVAGSTAVAQVHNNRHSTSSGSVSTKELEKFKTLAPEWWKSDGEYIALRSLNKLRVALIKEVLGGNEKIAHDPVEPLSGLKILDVGCGGGILAEPLARLGADVVGIDPLRENIEAANAHIRDKKEFEKLSYECTTIEDFALERAEYFDLVVASEVLEHVENTNIFVQDCCRAIKPGGRFVVTTINRTLLSTLLVKYAAEYLLRIVAQDTHDEDKFITPDEVVDMLRASGMLGINFRGMFMNPLTYHWSWTDTLNMNYAGYATKPL